MFYCSVLGSSKHCHCFSCRENVLFFVTGMAMSQAAIFPSRSFAQRADEFQSKGECKGAKVGDSVCDG